MTWMRRGREEDSTTDKQKKEENERGSLSGITIHRNKFKEDWKGA
jgi:hypothetical protein